MRNWYDSINFEWPGQWGDHLKYIAKITHKSCQESFKLTVYSRWPLNKGDRVKASLTVNVIRLDRFWSLHTSFFQFMQNTDIICVIFDINTVELVQSDILCYPSNIYGSKVFLLTNIKPEYSDILYKPTHFPGPFVCWIRHCTCITWVCSTWKIKHFILTLSMLYGVPSG